MDKDAVRIVPTDEGSGLVPIEDVHDARGRARPPVSVVVVMVVSTVGLLWMFNQQLESEPVEFRTVYTVPGWEATFESVKEFLPQPVSAHGYTWSLAALLDPEFGTIGAGSEVRMVIGRGQGLLAVGSSNRSAAVWSSIDGAIWSRVGDVDDASGTGYDRWMNAAAVGGPGLVAVGGERLTVVDPSGSSIDNDRNDDAAVWTSVDGSVFTRVPHDEEVFGRARLSMVVAGGPGLVAFGDDLQRDGVGVWVSRVGLSWSRVIVDESVFAGATVESVIVGGPGLVAVGHTETHDDSTAAVWVSPDGTSWSSIPHVESTFGGTGPVAMFDVTVGGPGLVAVGGDANGAIVWTSEDGVAWRRVPHDPEVFDSELRFGDFISGPMLSVATGQRDLLAVGPNDDALWASNDGITWQRTHIGFEGLRGDRLISTGHDYVLLDGKSVWQATPTDN